MCGGKGRAGAGEGDEWDEATWLCLSLSSTSTKKALFSEREFGPFLPYNLGFLLEEDVVKRAAQKRTALLVDKI